MSVESPVFADFKVEEPVGQEPTPSMKDLFAGLPMALDENLEHYSGLIGTKDKRRLKEEINRRYMRLSGIDNSIGFHGQLTAVDILDDNTYEAKLREGEERVDDYEVAVHESGHGWGAVIVGDIVKSETIVPGSDYRGLTETVSKARKSLHEFALSRAVVCLAGGIAVEMMGYKARGTGSDNAAAEAMCRLAVADPACPFSSPEQAYSHVRSFTEGAISKVGPGKMHHSALDLLERRTIV